MLFLLALGAYMTLMILAGIHGARRGTGLSHYFVADRDLGLLSTASTTAATTVGGSATITSVILIYTFGLTGLWLDLAGGLGLITLGLLLAGRVRVTGVYSLPELVGLFYNRQARMVASVLIILAEIAWIALLMQALRFILSPATGLDPGAALFLSAAIFIAYTVIGGQFAVAYSDVGQLTVMIVGICFIAAPIAFMEAGGMGTFTSRDPDLLSFPVSEGMPFRDVLPLFLMIYLPHLVGSDIYSKVLSARDPATARKGMVIAGGLRIMFGIAMAVIAFSAMGIFGSTAGNAGDLEDGSTDTGITAGEVLPRIIGDVLPSWAAVVVLIAFAGVMMSSADSCLLTGGTTFANDIFRFFRKGADERELLLAARSMVVVLGVIAYVIAVRIADIIDTLKLGYTVFSSSLILPVLLGFSRERFPVPSGAAITGMVAGGVTSLFWMYRVEAWCPACAAAMDPMIAGIAACALGILVPTMIHHARSWTLRQGSG